ncbi:Uncharacterised protein [Vibrio cholerae]|nr:Uncharacterised protein [Vibrio cholerae]
MLLFLGSEELIHLLLKVSRTAHHILTGDDVEWLRITCGKASAQTLGDGFGNDIQHCWPNRRGD